MDFFFKSCTGVFLRADLTGHGHTTCFGRKGLDGCALLAKAIQTSMMDLKKCFCFANRQASRSPKIGIMNCS